MVPHHFVLTKLSPIYFSTSIFACRAFAYFHFVFFIFFYFPFFYFANWHPHTHACTHIHTRREGLLVWLLLLLLCLSDCQAAAAAGFSAFSAFRFYRWHCCDSFSSFINAGSVKIYRQKKGKSSQMENYGCTRAHTHTHPHPHIHPTNRNISHPMNPVSFVISGCFIQFRGKRKFAKREKRGKW